MMFSIFCFSIIYHYEFLGRQPDNRKLDALETDFVRLEGSNVRLWLRLKLGPPAYEAWGGLTIMVVMRLR